MLTPRDSQKLLRIYGSLPLIIMILRTIFVNHDNTDLRFASVIILILRTIVFNHHNTNTNIDAVDSQKLLRIYGSLPLRITILRTIFVNHNNTDLRFACVNNHDSNDHLRSS